MGIRKLDKCADCQLIIFKVETADARMTSTATFPINSVIFTGRYLK